MLTPGAGKIIAIISTEGRLMGRFVEEGSNFIRISDVVDGDLESLKAEWLDVNKRHIVIYGPVDSDGAARYEQAWEEICQTETEE